MKRHLNTLVRVILISPFLLFAALFIMLANGVIYTAPGNTHFVDVAKSRNSQDIISTSFEDDKIELTVIQNRAPWYLASVKPKIIHGSIYLYPHYIPTRIHLTHFEVSLGKRELPYGWQERVYWVEGETIDSPINPFDEDFREIQRRRLIESNKGATVSGQRPSDPTGLEKE